MWKRLYHKKIKQGIVFLFFNKIKDETLNFVLYLYRVLPLFVISVYHQPYMHKQFHSF